jgi:hypothetical protein
MNTEFYLIMQLLEKVIPDDISNKILMILLGMTKTQAALCMDNNNKMTFDRGGKQYEIRPQHTRIQMMVMSEIRIAQFDTNPSQKKSAYAIRNIKQYMKTLDHHFKQRLRFLFC